MTLRQFNLAIAKQNKWIKDDLICHLELKTYEFYSGKPFGVVVLDVYGKDEIREVKIGDINILSTLDDNQVDFIRDYIRRNV